MSIYFQRDEIKCRVEALEKKILRFPEDPDVIRTLESAKADLEAIENQINPPAQIVEPEEEVEEEAVATEVETKTEEGTEEEVKDEKKEEVKPVKSVKKK